MSKSNENDSKVPVEAQLTRRELVRRITWGAPAVVATVTVGARAATATGGDPCEDDPTCGPCLGN